MVEWVLGDRDRRRGKVGGPVKGDQIKEECSTNDRLHFKIEELGRQTTLAERAISIETRVFGV